MNHNQNRSCIVRKANAADVPALAAIEEACFSDPWSARAIAETLSSPHAYLLCAESHEEARAENAPVLVGIGGFYLLGGDADITDIAVLPEYRRQGIGAQLLCALISAAKEHGVAAVHLEVRASNAAAIALYTRFGFQRDGVRRHYYKHPTEDAVLMTLVVG